MFLVTINMTQTLLVHRVSKIAPSSPKINKGHFGHIELARPVYHQGFFNVVLKALRCTCYHCSRPLMDESEFKFQKCKRITKRKRRFEAFHYLLKGREKRKCDYCNGYQPKYTKVGLHVEAEYSEQMDAIPHGGDRKQFLSAA